MQNGHAEWGCHVFLVHNICRRHTPWSSMLYPGLQNGHVYEGNVHEGVRHGKGRMIWKEGHWYEVRLASGQHTSCSLSLLLSLFLSFFWFCSLSLSFLSRNVSLFPCCCIFLSLSLSRSLSLYLSLAPPQHTSQSRLCATSCLVATESGPPRAVHLSRHKWPGGLVN